TATPPQKTTTITRASVARRIFATVPGSGTVVGWNRGRANTRSSPRRRERQRFDDGGRRCGRSRDAGSKPHTVKWTLAGTARPPCPPRGATKRIDVDGGSRSGHASHDHILPRHQELHQGDPPRPDRPRGVSRGAPARPYRRPSPDVPHPE